MNFEINDSYFGFKLTEKQYVKDIDSLAHVFTHEKSGAKLFYAQNEDENKVFFVSFKTPPQDDCGTAHILEHSVLCGSAKYVAKDPFNELMKGSLNTYLNALTYADKTMYPVASCNHEDLYNLMDVYMDAVFNPQVIKEKKIFMQEGWHYELNNAQEPITIKGVVYNEMKGALSGPDRVLNNAINQSLFTDSIYRFESGGDPEYIPELTYEKFVDFYNKYYHPSNSFFYLYGDMDIEKCLKHINDEYLVKYDAVNTKTKIIDQSTHNRPGFVSDTFAVPCGTKTGKESMLSLNFITGHSTDRLLALSMDVLSYILLETGASPIKKVLVDKKIAESAEGWFDSSTYQMVFSIVAKNSSCHKIGLFKDTVYRTLEDIVENGLDKALIQSALNYYEFLLKEADYGYRPKGLVYGMNMMKGWLHGESPMEALKVWEHFDTMRRGAENGYFENLIKIYFLENPNSSIAAVAAEEGKQELLEERNQKHLKEMKEDMSQEHMELLVKETKDLIEYQSSGDTKEVIEKIPTLCKDDINKKADFDIYQQFENNGVRELILPLDTNGIVYTKFMFSTDTVPTELVPYVGLLGRVLGKLDTEKFDYEKLSTQTDMFTGGIYGRLEVYNNSNDVMPVLCINAKALMRNMDKMVEIIQQIIFETKFDMQCSLSKIILDLKAEYERHFDNNGHLSAITRCFALFDEAGAYKDATAGIAFNDFLLKAGDNIKETAEGLKKVSELIFAKENLLISVAAKENNIEEVRKMLYSIEEKLPKSTAKKENVSLVKNLGAEAVENGAKVVYNAKAANFIKEGFKYSGKMSVIKNIINTQYLWNEVRVKGGAYGCGCNFSRNGNVYTYSYRDPNVKETFNNFDNIGNFLSNISLTEREITKYTLGAINVIDRPKSKSDRLELMVARYYNGLTREDVQRERDEILSVTEKDVKEYAELFNAVMKKGAICTFGSETKINENKALYQQTRKLYNKRNID
ncbi:MAG: insulinase family protein [Anaerotignaceae bacterium]